MASMDAIYQGAAIFSTRSGNFKPRNTTPPSIILRTNPDDDQDEMVARLQRMFPQECKLIRTPVANVAHYFDPYDMHHYGYCFLESVLGTIARHNWIRARHVQSFVKEWMRFNRDRFEGIMSMSYGDFSATATHTHGEDFGREVFGLLQSYRTHRSAATGRQIHQPIHQSQKYAAAPRSSFSHATHQPGSNTSKSQENTPSSHNYTHESPSQSSSNCATLQPGPTPKKSRVNTSSYRSHANETSPQSSSSGATPQGGSDPSKSQANTSSSQSLENGGSSKPSSSYAPLQSGPNQRKFRANNSYQSHANRNSSKFSSSYGAARSGPNQRKSRVSSGSSGTYPNGTLSSNAHGSFQNHVHGAPQIYPHGTSQSHEYRGSQTYAQGSYQQQPSDFVAFQPDSYGGPPAMQHSHYGSRQLPVRAYFPPLRDYHSDPEYHIGRPQTQYVGPIVVDASPEQQGPFLYHFQPPLTSQDPVTVPNPVKTVSDDARVLEMQEAANRRILDESNNLGGSLLQLSEKPVGKLPDPELHGSALPITNSHVSSEQPATYILDRDPAVISVGSKPDRALDQSDHHSADVHPSPRDEKGGFLASLMQKHQSPVEQPPTPPVSEIIETDSPAGLHDANAHQTHHQSNNVKTPSNAKESPTHGTQSESIESSGHKEEFFDRKVTSDGEKQAVDLSQPIHENFKSSDTHSASFHDNSYRNRSDTSNSNAKDTVWVGGLYPTVTEAKLVEIFEPYGEIKKVSKVFARDGETSWAFAFVTFLTEEAADRAIECVDFGKYDDMTLKVRYAERPRRYRDVNHRISSEGSKFDSPNQDSTMNLAENISLPERKGRDVTNPSLGRRHGYSTGISPSEQAKRLSKSKLPSGKTIETSSTVSGSNSRQNHKAFLPGAHDRNVAAHAREVSKSSKGAVAMKGEIKIAEHSSRLSQGPENVSTVKEGREIAKESPVVDEILQKFSTVEQEVKVAENSSSTAEQGVQVAKDPSSTVEQGVKAAKDSSSTVEQGVKVAKDSSILSDSLPNSSEIEPKALPDVAKQQKSAEPGRGGGALADALTVDLSTQDHSQTLPRNMTETDSVLAAEPQANQDADASTSSLAAEDNSVSIRLSHKLRWKIQQRATKAAKQKQILEKEQQQSGAKDIGISVETSGGSIGLDTKSEGNDLSVSENVPSDAAKQQLQLETDLQNSSDENSQSETIGRTESSIATQNQIPSASQCVEAPETLSMGVSETSSADWPSLPKRVEVDGTEASPSLETAVSTQQTKKKKKKQKNSTTVPKDVETACKPEPSPDVIEKAADIETLPDQVHETDIRGDGDGNSGIPIDEEATERKCEPIDPLRTESITPTPDHPDSTTAQPKNTKSRKGRKSKGKKKAKSAEGSSQTPAFPAEESAEALAASSKEVLTQASAVPSGGSAEAEASVRRIPPAPETPYLAEQTQDNLPVEVDKKETDQTHVVRPTDSDDKGEGQTRTIIPVEINKQRKERQKNKSTSTAEEPHICSRRELTRYHYLKDRDYWPQISKIIREQTDSDSSLSTEAMPENPRNSEVGEPGVSDSQPINPVEANPAASTVDSVEGKMAEGEFKGQLDNTGSGTAAKPKLSNVESANERDSSAAGIKESSIPNPKAVIEHAGLPSALSTVGQSVADLESPPKSTAASSGAAGSSNTPPAPYTRTGTESSPSLGKLSDYESSESSTLQSDDEDSTDNSVEEPAVTREPYYSIYPFHPSARPAGIPQSQLFQTGDVLREKISGDGRKILVRDRGEMEISGEVLEEEKEREKVERQDTHVILRKEPWGYTKSVWID